MIDLFIIILLITLNIISFILSYLCSNMLDPDNIKLSKYERKLLQDVIDLTIQYHGENRALEKIYKKLR